MQISRSVGRPKLEKRRTEILLSAAQVFAQKGFDGASIRDIAVASDVHSSSLYHFFGSKDGLFEEVYREGVQRIIMSVNRQISNNNTPWEKIESAAIGHLKSLLEDDVFSIVVANIVPRGNGEFEQRLIVHRNQYEKMFADLIADLSLPSEDDARYLRLALLSALNATVYWYKAGKDNPETIARHMVALFHRELAPEIKRNGL